MEAMFAEAGMEMVVRVRPSDIASEDSRLAFMKAVIVQLAAAKPRVVVFDIAGNDLLSSGTLGAFLRFRRSGIKVALRNASYHVMEILERTNLTGLFDVQTDPNG